MIMASENGFLSVADYLINKVRFGIPRAALLSILRTGSWTAVWNIFPARRIRSG